MPLAAAHPLASARGFSLQKCFVHTNTRTWLRAATRVPGNQPPKRGGSEALLTLPLALEGVVTSLHMNPFARCHCRRWCEISRWRPFSTRVRVLPGPVFITEDSRPAQPGSLLPRLCRCKRFVDQNATLPRCLDAAAGTSQDENAREFRSGWVSDRSIRCQSLAVRVRPPPGNSKHVAFKREVADQPGNK